MQILVRLHTGRTIVMNIELTETVSDLKDKIKDREGIPAHAFYLNCNGRPLGPNDSVLSNFNIERDSIVYVNIRSTMIDQ